MSEPKMLTLRVQSSEGTARVSLPQAASTAALFEAVHGALHLDSFAFALYRDRARRDEVLSSKSRRLQDLGLTHGDMLYLTPVNGARIFHETPTNEPAASIADEVQPSSSSAPIAPPIKSTSQTPKEDEVDLILYEQSGKIQRQRDDKLCRHNSLGCCVHCSPLEPWDEAYLKEHNIKHLSFHSYLRKITSGKFVSLDEISLRIKPGCKEHPAWPRGICSYCRPRGLTLARQPYRHVDNLVLQRASLGDRFIAAWRTSGEQRVGFLYGTYEPHPDVPLGIRALVSFIYEPAQQCTRDKVTLLEDPLAPALEEVAQSLQLKRLGWIFTDLLPGDQPGTVQHIRGVDSHFLSAQECITAGHFQNLHPNPCRYAPNGYYGSKFLTVCVTGDSNNQVHMEGYQVSAQCQALVREDMLLPTKDAPDLGYVRPSGKDRYVPDVYYKERDSYGNDVGVSTNHVPVAYLLVDVPCGVLNDGANSSEDQVHFPVENRPRDPQTLNRLHEVIQQGGLQALSDPHILLFLHHNPALPLSMEQLSPLIAALKANDSAGLEAWAAMPQPATLLQLAQASNDMPNRVPLGGGSGSGSGSGTVWTCPLCTFHNAADRDSCEMCAMPRNSA